MCWRNFCNFSLVTRKCEKWVKIALFSNERHFEIWFPKKRIITFFWSKLSKLHKKDPILHVATIFSLKQGETRTSHGPIPHPLIPGKFFPEDAVGRRFSIEANAGGIPDSRGFRRKVICPDTLELTSQNEIKAFVASTPQ